uniref:DUF1871 family protein n=1 Tax=Lacibacter sediminis TaxID=2760713 RepID=UPI00389923A5
MVNFSCSDMILLSMIETSFDTIIPLPSCTILMSELIDFSRSASCMAGGINA